MNYEEVLYGIIANTGLEVYPGIVAQGTPKPYVIYTQTALERINGLVGYAQSGSRFQVDIYTDTVSERNTMWTTIENALIADGIEYIVYTEANSNELDVYRKRIDLKLWSQN